MRRLRDHARPVVRAWLGNPPCGQGIFVIFFMGKSWKIIEVNEDNEASLAAKWWARIDEWLNSPSITGDSRFWVNRLGGFLSRTSSFVYLKLFN